MQRPHASPAPVESRTWLVLATQAVQAGPAEHTMAIGIKQQQRVALEVGKQKLEHCPAVARTLWAVEHRVGLHGTALADELAAYPARRQASSSDRLTVSCMTVVKVLITGASSVPGLVQPQLASSSVSPPDADPS